MDSSPVPPARRDAPAAIMAVSPTLSARLRTLAGRCEDKAVTLARLIEVSEGRAYDLLVILLALPFLVPVPVPVLSTLFGTVIMLVGAQQALGRVPWLPKRLLRAELPARFLQLTLNGAGRVLGWMERGLRPRLQRFARSGWRQTGEWMVAASGALLLLPLPVPFSNTLPAITILLLTAGSLERDGRAILLGFGFFGATLAYFAGIGFGGVALTDQVREWMFPAE